MRFQTKQLTKRNARQSSHGFSLIELLIVVAIILIIAAIAIPNFIRSKMRANEATAVENLRTISTAEVVYSTTYNIGFSPSLAAISGNTLVPDQTQAGLIDTVLAAGVKTGYNYTYSVVTMDSAGNVTNYCVNADPVIQGTSGDRHFYTDQSAIIRQNLTAPAGPNDPGLQ
jgi:prepilin-type N-terminal cleavage/methylation domain-containing protein